MGAVCPPPPPPTDPFNPTKQMSQSFINQTYGFNLNALIEESLVEVPDKDPALNSIAAKKKITFRENTGHLLNRQNFNN